MEIRFYFCEMLISKTKNDYDFNDNYNIGFKRCFKKWPRTGQERFTIQQNGGGFGIM